MRIFVKTKASAKKDLVEKIDATHFRIEVKIAPQNGKANEAIARVLSDYFGVAVFRVCLVSGATSKNKVFNIK